MSQRTCFFITPIGDADSKERLQSDKLIENALKYCCEPFDLELIRADHLRGTSDINSDVIELLHSAEICIVDLTGLNANVMFELGIRMETGLPVIIIAKNGTKLPFDIHSIRTIFFDDIDASNECNKLIAEIRAYINICSADNYQKSSTTPTISDVYSLLENISKMLSATPVSSNTDLNSLYASTDVEQLLSSLDPSEAFQYAYKSNQISIAEKLLDYLKDQPPKYYRNKLCALASLGSLKAMNEIEKLLPQVIDVGNFDEVFELLGSLVSCYMRRDIENQKEIFITPIFDKAMSLADKNAQKAAILNQQQRLLAGMGNYDAAVTLIKEAIALYDEEPAYYFNYATLLKKLGNTDAAKEQIRKCVELSLSGDDPHEDGLVLACKLFKNSDKEEEQKYYSECYQLLKQINPIKARLVNFD